ncbi:MAG: radical SAM protein [Clostridiales bacterium]|nr:radical SAM protein [Clostridiales bacterium]
MVVEQIVYPIDSLGPGRRIGIWLVGCDRHCPGCSNPELWSREGWPSMDVEMVVELVESVFRENQVDGITISGGEPMEQAGELAALTRLLSNLTRDILVYSGYTYEEICSAPEKEEVLDSIAVLVDGRYIKEKNTHMTMRGSENQHIYLFRPDFETVYREYLANNDPKRINNFHLPEGTISVGIHGADFSEKLREKLQKKGVVKKNG